MASTNDRNLQEKLNWLISSLSFESCELSGRVKFDFEIEDNFEIMDVREIYYRDNQVDVTMEEII